MSICMDETKSLNLFAQWNERVLNVFKEHLGVYLLLIVIVATEHLLSNDFAVKIFFQAIFSGLFEATSFILIYVFIPQKIRKFYSLLLVSLYELDFLIALISYGFYGKVMVSEICVLILSTNVKEVSEFFTGYIYQLNLSNLIVGGSVLLLTIHVVTIALKCLLKRQTKVVSYVGISLYSITLLLLPTHTWLYANSVPLQIKAVLNTYIDLLDYVKPAHLVKSRNNQPDDIVLIIGESHCKSHCSLYDYEKNTNPLLDERKKNEELFVFTDVVSAATTTIPSFKYMMSTFSYQSSLSWYEEQTLPQIIKEAGYTSYWFSNQSKLGFWNNVIVKYANLFDNTYFYEDLVSNNHANNYDEDVLFLRKQYGGRDDSKKFIVYHLMGSHPDFKQRSPNKFKHFQPYEYKREDSNVDETLAEYDNSLLYNDFVVDSIISCYQQKDALVIYLSDHALDLFQTDNQYAGHAKAEKESILCGIEIPFWIYVSPLFKKKHPLVVQRIKDSVNRSFMTDNLVYVLMDIMGVDFKDDLNKVSECSLLGLNYKTRDRVVNGINIDK